MTLKVITVIVCMTVGAVSGFAIAFLLRPSGFLVGQLPFMVVITGGRYLTGLNAFYQPLAQTSLNYCLAASWGGVLLGFVLGLLICAWQSKSKADAAVAR